MTKVKGKEVSTSDMTLDGDTMHTKTTDSASGNVTEYDAKRK